MAKNDIRIRETAGGNSVPTYTWQTEAAATDIKAGEPVKLKSAGSPYVIPWADADITPGTDTLFIGLAKSDSTHTASADGTIEVYMPLQHLVYEGKAKSSTAADTQAEINAMCGDRVPIDLTSSSYTVDTAAGDAVTNSLLIVGGDPTRKVIYFQIRPWANVVDAA